MMLATYKKVFRLVVSTIESAFKNKLDDLGSNPDRLIGFNLVITVENVCTITLFFTFKNHSSVSKHEQRK